jgi:trk system potassium uptake protein TrkH
MITINIFSIYNSFEEAFRHSLFQVASIISTTGYSTTDFAMWPALSQGVIIIIMMSGACAGSTAGGFKLSRVNVLLKSSASKIKNAISPRKVEVIRFEGKPMDDNTVNTVQNYLSIYILLIIFIAFIISFDGTHGLLENITTSITMINNVGPGLGAVGPMGSFAGYSYFSKIVLSIAMIAGRLELIPILVLFNPNTWKKRN